MNILEKFKETVISVLPVMIIVLILSLTAVPLGVVTILKFVLGGIFLIFGLTIFLLGVDLALKPIGERCGAELTKKKSLLLLLLSALLIGFLVTVAEPDIQVFASQVKNVISYLNKNAFIFTIAFGVGFFMLLGLLRSVLHFPLKILLLLCYTILFAFAFFAPQEFWGIAFDSGGATTGPLTVPFIMALGLGVSSVSSSNNEDSFGLTGITSIGPVFAVIVYSFFLSGKTTTITNQAQNIITTNTNSNIIAQIFFPFFANLGNVAKEAFVSLIPLIFLFVLFQLTLLKMTKRQVTKICVGLVYSFIGLTLFLLGVSHGFIPVGNALGNALGAKAQTSSFYFALLIITGVMLGAIVVCAEPAVWVLTDQVEQVSGGTIKRRVLLVFLSIGAALAIGLALLRAVFGFSIKYILIPGYALALILMIFSPKLWTGIAFDSGGVASGPITSTFVLSFTLGASNAARSVVTTQGTTLPLVTDAFGVIALVAMMPLLAIQILGIIYTSKKRISEKRIKKSTQIKRGNK